MIKKLIDNAYDLARTKYPKKPFTFKQLWKDLIKKARLDSKDQEQIGHVYADMLQDHRFIFVGNDQWKIREFLTLEQQEEYSNAIYDFSKDEPVSKPKEEEYGPDFDFDEDDEYKQHTEAAIDDEDEEGEDEIDNESESSQSNDSDEDIEETDEIDEEE